MYFCDQHLLNIVMTSQKASGYPGYKNKNKIGKLSHSLISRGREFQKLIARCKNVRCPEADL